MNLMQKAIIKNVRNQYETMPHSQASLNELEDLVIYEGFPILITMKLYDEYQAENIAYKKEQERIYGKDFNEQIALKRGSKMFEEIIKKHIKQLNKYAKNKNDRNKAIRQAKLILKTLKPCQSYTDEQIKDALLSTKNSAYNIWKNERNANDTVYKTITEINNCALAINCQE